MSKLRIKTAAVFEPLLAPSRYKAAFGGRGSGKSHHFADDLIERATYFPTEHGRGIRVVCIREVQKDLTHSAKQLIEDKLKTHGLGPAHGWRILKSHIETPGGGIIIFRGMMDYNAQSIKSLEGFDVAWVEEGQTLSETSLSLLRPTIRAEGSELWFSWNPDRPTDAVDKMFRGKDGPPTGSIVVRANWYDNPWLPMTLNQERLDCLNNDPEEYDHIWEAGYKKVTKGAYYAKHLAKARAEQRIARVSADPLLPFQAFCDLGGTGARSDAFAMWIAQFVGTEVRIPRYYEAQGQELSTHLRWLRAEGYGPDDLKIWLPHDGATHDRVIHVSFQSSFEQAGYEVEIVQNQGRGAASARIEAGRRMLPSCRFDERGCEEYGGLTALGHYHEKKDEHRGIGLGPNHDWSSHCADAFGMMAIAREVAPAAPGKRIDFVQWGG